MQTEHEGDTMFNHQPEIGPYSYILFTFSNFNNQQVAEYMKKWLYKKGIGIVQETICL